MEISRSVGQHGGSTSRLSGSQGRCQPTRSVSSVGILSVNSGIVQLASSVCVLWASVAICALQGWIGICLLIAIVATALNFLLFKQAFGYWNSLIMLFWFSHAAYGISGPLSWYLSETSIPLYREINYTEFYVMFYALSSLGFTLGSLLVSLRRTRNHPARVAVAPNPRALFWGFVILGLFGPCLSCISCANWISRRFWNWGKAFIILASANKI
jgi:hypothetical protein